MKYLLIIIMVVITILGCRNSNETNLVTNFVNGKDYLFHNDTLSLYGDKSIADLERLQDAFDLDQNIEKSLTVEVIVDASLSPRDLDINKDLFIMMDSILTLMKLGGLIDLESVEEPTNPDLSFMKTEDSLNVNNIVDLFINGKKSIDIFDESKDIHVYLFKHSTFFNTANAIALKSDGHRFIFGNGEIFKSAMLFVHELGHTLGLNHVNSKYYSVPGDSTSCYLYNIMHESNIGCATLFDSREIALMKFGEYTCPSGKTFPEESFVNNGCGCNTTEYLTKIDKYLNAKDRGLECDMLVGDFMALDESQMENILNDSLPKSIRENIVLQSSVFFRGTTFQKLFIDQEVSGAKALRKNNLIRLIGESRKYLGEDLSEEDWQAMFTSPSFISDSIYLKFKNDVVKEKDNILNNSIETPGLCSILQEKLSASEAKKEELNDDRYSTANQLEDEIERLFVVRRNIIKVKDRVDDKEAGNQLEREVTKLSNLIKRLNNVIVLNGRKKVKEKVPRPKI